MNIHTPEDTSWREHKWAEQQKVPERIEDAAKFLATMISISLTISIKVFDVGGDTKLPG